MNISLPNSYMVFLRSFFLDEKEPKNQDKTISLPPFHFIRPAHKVAKALCGSSNKMKFTLHHLHRFAEPSARGGELTQC